MLNPDVLRLTLFLCVLLLCAVWEWRMPRKTLTQNKPYRWLNNLGLTALNSLLLSLLMPILAIEAAILAAEHHFGLLNHMQLPFWVEIIIAVVVLDLTIYLQHWVFHRVPLLWRLHRVHHADQDIDVTTGARFHPLEMLLSMWVKMAVVSMMGISPVAVITFEIILNVSAMFNHSNAYLPQAIDKVLRKILVTPDMHRVHHSKITKETHSNFGFFLSIWDRCFKTYRAQPALGHHKVEIGLPIFHSAKEQRLDKMLTQPFRS